MRNAGMLFNGVKPSAESYIYPKILKTPQYTFFNSHDQPSITISAEQ